MLLPSQIEKLFDHPPADYTEEHFELFDAFKKALNRGEVRAAAPDASAKSGWRANAWVKKGILLGFRMGATVDMSVSRAEAAGDLPHQARQAFIDKATYPARVFTPEQGIRVVPGGSSVRSASGRGAASLARSSCRSSAP